MMKSPTHDTSSALPLLRRAKGLIALGAVAFAVVAAGPANADQKKQEPGANLSCAFKWSWGTTYYPPGSKITVKMPDGTSHTYQCDGATGNWKSVRTAPTPTIYYSPNQEGMTVAPPQ